MDEIIAAVAQRTGLPADKARTAVETVVEQLRQRLPGPVAQQIDGFLGGSAGQGLGGLGDAAKGLGGMFGR